MAFLLGFVICLAISGTLNMLLNMRQGVDWGVSVLVSLLAATAIGVFLG
jgi:hypothetical protein